MKLNSSNSLFKHVLNFKNPDPKTTALGGVDIGSMNAHEAANVALTSKSRCTSIANAIVTSTGKSMAVVAMFEVTSVNKLMDVTMISIIKNKDTLSRF